jgi:hypothetical protein
MGSVDINKVNKIEINRVARNAYSIIIDGQPIDRVFDFEVHLGCRSDSLGKSIKNNYISLTCDLDLPDEGDNK